MGCLTRFGNTVAVRGPLLGADGTIMVEAGVLFILSGFAHHLALIVAEFTPHLALVTLFKDIIQ